MTPEDRLHQSIADYMRVQYPQGGRLVWFHVPNQNNGNVRWRQKLKRMGVRAGVADLMLKWGGGVGAIEIKVEGGRQSDSQKEFQADWEALGGRYAVCRSIEDVRETLAEWGLVKGRD